MLSLKSIPNVYNTEQLKWTTDVQRTPSSDVTAIDNYSEVNLERNYLFLFRYQGVGQSVAVLLTTPTTSFKASGTVKATLKTFKANSYSPKATPKTPISFHKYSQSRSNSVNQQICANMFKTS